MHLRALLTVGRLLLGGAATAAIYAADASDLLRDGHAHLRAAEQGADGAAARALAAFEAALRLDPACIRARAGRGLALIATALEAPVAQKLALARSGCAELDAAVAAAPDDAAVRLMRATSAMKLPLLLERQSVAERDFQLLLAAAGDKQVTMSAETRRSIYYQAAAYALKERRPGAIGLLEKAAATPATEPTDEQVQSLLALAHRHAKPSPSHADRHPPEEAPASRP